jgi:hypothetical protein
MVEWGSSDSYLMRLNALAGSLNTSTVQASYQNGKLVVDYRYGNANDWFFAAVNVVIKDKNKNDEVTKIS